MKITLYKWMLSLCGLLFLASCEKDNITNSYMEDNPNRMSTIAHDLKKTMASSPDGWVMLVKTSLASEAYTPIILKFDTVKNRVNIRTVYGPTDPSKEDYFRITNGTGAPQLIFTTGSIMSTLYRIGAQASDITDHIYNVVKVTPDEIHIQPYRSGKVYAPEGGVVYKLFKTPANWKWATNTSPIFDFNLSGFTDNVFNVNGTLSFEYVNTPSKNKTFNTQWAVVPSNLITAIRNGFPFNISRNIGAGGFATPDYIGFKFPYNTNTLDGYSVVANNAISFYPGAAGNAGAVANLRNFVNTYGFHYLVCNSVIRSGNNVKMEFEAYDKEGKVIIKALYDNKL